MKMTVYGSLSLDAPSYEAAREIAKNLGINVEEVLEDDTNPEGVDG